jgi:hypothetical protein
LKLRQDFVGVVAQTKSAAVGLAGRASSQACDRRHGASGKTTIARDLNGERVENAL